MRLEIGGLRLPSAVVQSPMSSVTDLPFRLVSRRRGLAFAFTEMVCAQALLRKNRKTLDLLKTAPGDRPLGAQVLGRDPAQMAAAAAMLAEMGFDLIDINCGCPVKKVVANGEGAALLDDPGRAERIFAAVRKAVKLPLTVKTRKGFHDESGLEAVELARRAEAQGLDAVTVHGRTRRQGYGGQADYEAVARVRRAVAIPVIGNGDVRCGEDALRLKAVSGCQGVMIGRGALGNPWLYLEVHRALTAAPSGKGEPQPSRADGPLPVERCAALLEHFDLEVEFLGPRQAALNMRRIGAWYTSGFPGAKNFRAGLCRAMDVGTLRRMILDFFAGLPGEPV